MTPSTMVRRGGGIGCGSIRAIDMAVFWSTDLANVIKGPLNTKVEKWRNVCATFYVCIISMDEFTWACILEEIVLAAGLADLVRSCKLGFVLYSFCCSSIMCLDRKAERGACSGCGGVIKYTMDLNGMISCSG